jgi:hypothetical protein
VDIQREREKSNTLNRPDRFGSVPVEDVEYRMPHHQRLHKKHRDDRVNDDRSNEWR